MISDGHELVLVARSKNFKNKYKDFSEKINCYTYDLSRVENISMLFKKIKKDVGPLHSFISCVGFHDLKPLKTLTSDDISRSMLINFISPIITAQHFSSNLFSTGTSRDIVFISSISNKKPEKGLLSYSASKSALTIASKILALELSTKDIRVNSISPGWVNTQTTQKIKKNMSKDNFEKIISQYPLGTGNPKDVSELVSFLISKNSNWITGQDIIIDGGRSLI